MKVLIAPDKFKGSMNATQLCSVIATVLEDHGIRAIKHPLADGGDGSLDILKSYFELRTATVLVNDPLGRKISAEYLHSGSEAFIELASASGHVLLSPDEMNPLLTSTIGTGEMILDAIQRGINNITLFLGGSSTNDAGIGILHALGFGFFDNKGQSLQPIGESLEKIRRIQVSANAFLNDLKLTLVCDVSNPLYGEQGAAHTYARQKGASEKVVKRLDKGLQNFASVIQEKTGIRVQDIPGTGAAGGIAGGLVPLVNAQIRPGAEHFMDLTGFHDKLPETDAIITGEGCLDGQSTYGKLAYAVYRHGKKAGIPVYFFVGHCKYNEIPELDNKSIYALTDIAKSKEEAISQTETLLIRQVLRFIKYVQSPGEDNQ